jgi:hypothetical protein
MMITYFLGEEGAIKTELCCWWEIYNTHLPTANTTGLTVSAGRNEDMGEKGVINHWDERT